MGCGSSKELRDNTDQPRISAPQGGLELIPVPRRDERGIPITHQHYDLDRVHLRRALHYAAEYLHDQGANVEIITVGGAVNTILLQTRSTTHDVDFFVSQDRSPQMRLLEQASRVAEAKASLPLGGNWLNNATTLYIPSRIRQELAQEAVEQNDVVFQAPGLTVLAAPWLYALCTKIDRLGDRQKRRRYDQADAVAYLRRYTSRHRRQPVVYQNLTKAAAHYRIALTVEICQEINREYEAQFGQPGIRF